MFYKLLRILIAVVGFMIGPGILLLVEYIIGYISGGDPFSGLQSWFVFILFIISALISGLIFLFLSKRIAAAIVKATSGAEKALSQASSGTLLSGAIGLIIGLVIAALISGIIGLIENAWIAVPLTIAVYLIFGYLGLSTGVKRRGDMTSYISARKAGKTGVRAGGAAPPKILDTSVIIDGRIYDISKTGIIEGDMIIPGFVLAELQAIADSADALKRTRGRRGLDVLGKMQKNEELAIRVTDRDFSDATGVDAKLLRLAKEMGGVLVTNDYNLNKVAAVQNVRVFNINELANAVKPVMMAGEEIGVTIVKDGKEAGQGIGYLDDGTMIVVEGAGGMNERAVTAVVTSVLQTAAGRMIFARLK